MSDEIELSGMTVQLRLQTPYDIVLHAGVPKAFSAEQVNGLMDMLTDVAEREQLKGRLREARARQRSNRERLASATHDRQLDELRRQRAAYDVRMARHWVESERRGEPKLTARQQSDMEKYNQQIAEQEKLKRDLEAGVVLGDWQIDCLYAQLARQPEPPMPDEVRAVIQQLDMPEDVSLQAA